MSEKERIVYILKYNYKKVIIFYYKHKWCLEAIFNLIIIKVSKYQNKQTEKIINNKTFFCIIFDLIFVLLNFSNFTKFLSYCYYV